MTCLTLFCDHGPWLTGYKKTHSREPGRLRFVLGRERRGGERTAHVCVKCRHSVHSSRVNQVVQTVLTGAPYKPETVGTPMISY